MGSPRATAIGSPAGRSPPEAKEMIPIRTCGGIGTTCREPDVRPEALLIGAHCHAVPPAPADWITSITPTLMPSGET